MKILHTSDWHLGRQFHNASLISEQAAVLEQFVKVIEEHDIDVVVLAGDVYDRAIPPTAAISLLNEVVDKICRQLSVPMIIIPGNHDSAVRLGFGAKAMQVSGLHIISSLDSFTTPVTLSDTFGEIDFYTIPYVDPEHVRAYFNNDVRTHEEIYRFLIQALDEVRETNRRAVLVAHCFVDGGEESDSERPLSIGGSDRVSADVFKGFDYVALGHLHQAQFKSFEHVRYAGSLLKYSFSEQNQNKSCTLVELQEKGTFDYQLLPLKAEKDVRVIEGTIAEIVEQGKLDEHRQDFILARLLDKSAILSPMEKLRSVYPNTLHIEKPGMLVEWEQSAVRRLETRNELSMFADFFEQVQQHPLSDDQQAALSKIVGVTRREEDS